MTSPAHDTSPATYDARGAYMNYLTGFALSVFLTLIPFALVMSGWDIGIGWALAVIFGFGAIQVIVHVHYFLHVSAHNEQGWQVLSLLFTIILLVIVLSGSIWVMFHLKENMMPAHEQIERVKNLP
ncbi:MAG: cytochrome o ubiquinol oxidase subunit IV [Rhodobacteraceae bacterium]|nr:cytochrome o ubiquinol oxidase subunit IV [Paracoccaceae bacterium]MAY45192.1 cytochrome o ubiquinol oxidase subunit IV [Paracoccaceae bacterium]QEW17884.1 Cytochrome o ubiquinol oxidase protein CyoD [Marinibacterium anthonyi]QEW18029.1 Cytochrome o ubiquinol oxidase protein CyoD [Marinibacterium anthonyi]|tara:strand:- start:734 stop:1111 length:378 start_codon:yes stop_codon:yes gene_type:complete